jgi:hypothetical protein
MSVTTVEGIIKDGHIILPKGFELPDKAKFYMIFPEIQETKKLRSPKLADRADAEIFKKRVTADNEDEI